jgi:hypothetical protein
MNNLHLDDDRESDLYIAGPEYLFAICGTGEALVALSPLIRADNQSNLSTLSLD